MIKRFNIPMRNIVQNTSLKFSTQHQRLASSYAKHLPSSLPNVLWLRLARSLVIASLWTALLCSLSFEVEALVALAVCVDAASNYSMPSHTLDRSKSSVSPPQDANDKRV